MGPTEARNQRKQLALSQVKLANIAGVSRYRYIMWELGNDPLAPEELRLVEDALRRMACAQIERLSSLSQVTIDEPGV
jgi:transcriptional regulator with XRE-family HTH domain